MKVCPTNGLQPVLWEAGLEGLYTPRLVPRLGYCIFTCSLCGQVCPTGAIPKLELEVKQATAPGTAHVNHSRCIPYSEGAECLVCEENCPVSPKAITANVIEVLDQQGRKSPGESPGGATRPLHRLRPLRIRLPRGRRGRHPGKKITAGGELSCWGRGLRVRGPLPPPPTPTPNPLSWEKIPVRPRPGLA